jgi:hypothetical protein
MPTFMPITFEPILKDRPGQTILGLSEYWLAREPGRWRLDPDDAPSVRPDEVQRYTISNGFWGSREEKYWRLEGPKLEQVIEELIAAGATTFSFFIQEKPLLYYGTDYRATELLLPTVEFTPQSITQ